MQHACILPSNGMVELGLVYSTAAGAPWHAMAHRYSLKRCSSFLYIHACSVLARGCVTRPCCFGRCLVRGGRRRAWECPPLPPLLRLQPLYVSSELSLCSNCCPHGGTCGRWQDQCGGDDGGEVGGGTGR